MGNRQPTRRRSLCRTRTFRIPITQCTQSSGRSWASPPPISWILRCYAARSSRDRRPLGPGVRRSLVGRARRRQVMCRSARRTAASVSAVQRSTRSTRRSTGRLRNMSTAKTVPSISIRHGGGTSSGGLRNSGTTTAREASRWRLPRGHDQHPTGDLVVQIGAIDVAGVHQTRPVEGGVDSRLLSRTSLLICGRERTSPRRGCLVPVASKRCASTAVEGFDHGVFVRCATQRTETDRSIPTESLIVVEAIPSVYHSDSDPTRQSAAPDRCGASVRTSAQRRRPSSAMSLR